jgi:hypothetical protein
MNQRRILEIGGLLAGIVLIVFGAVAIYMGVDGRDTVRDSVAQEQIYFGEAEDPAVAKHAEQWAGEQVTNGDQARAFAAVMREHTLEGSGGLTYAQMGRFQLASNPEDPAGTNDAELAAKDEAGAPIPNAERQTWVTETALTTALNMSYMAEQLAIFGIVVGVALLLAGVGFVILALVVLGRHEPRGAAQRGATAPAVTV